MNFMIRFFRYYSTPGYTPAIPNSPKPKKKTPLIPVIPTVIPSEKNKSKNLVPMIPSQHNRMHPSVSPDVSSEIPEDYYGGYVTPGGPSGNSFKLSASVMGSASVMQKPSIASSRQSSYQPSFEIHSSSVILCKKFPVWENLRFLCCS